MKVDSCSEGQSHSCPKDFVKPMQLDMEENGSQGTPRRRLSGSRPPLHAKGVSSDFVKACKELWKLTP